MNFWFFAAIVWLSLVGLFILAMKVRITDGRADRIARQVELDRTGQEAITVLTANNNLENTKYLYAQRQAEFGMRVLDLFEQGKWTGDTAELIAACQRQLDGIAPPYNAPTLAIRQQPMARWPDGTPYNEMRKM